MFVCIHTCIIRLRICLYPYREVPNYIDVKIDSVPYFFDNAFNGFDKYPKIRMAQTFVTVQSRAAWVQHLTYISIHVFLCASYMYMVHTCICEHANT